MPKAKDVTVTDDAQAKPEAPRGNPQAQPPAQPPVPPKIEMINLDDFCLRLSESDRRVSLISGFHAHCKAKGDTRNTLAAFRAKFSAYTSRPII